MRRISEQTATLENMPASLARYQSEYHFLFEVIYRFHRASDKTVHEVLMLLPNAVTFNVSIPLTTTTPVLRINSKPNHLVAKSAVELVWNMLTNCCAPLAGFSNAAAARCIPCS